MIVRRAASPSPRLPSRGFHKNIFVCTCALLLPHTVEASVTDDWLRALEQCRLAMETDLTLEDLNMTAASGDAAKLFVIAPQTVTMEDGFALEVVPGRPAPESAWYSMDGHFLLGGWSSICTVKAARDLSESELKRLLTAARNAQRKLVDDGSHIPYDLGLPDSFAVKLAGRNGKGRCVVSYVLLAEDEGRLIGTSGEQMALFCRVEPEDAKK